MFTKLSGQERNDLSNNLTVCIDHKDEDLFKLVFYLRYNCDVKTEIHKELSRNTEGIKHSDKRALS